jgi:hypothetical protein
MEITETFLWDQILYDHMVSSMKKGATLMLDNDQFGSIIDVSKKQEKDGTPFIEVLFLPYS